MLSNDRLPEQGSVVIANEVIASIAANAVKDVEGFGSFAGRTPELMRNEMPKSVRVWNLDNDVKIQIYINVKSGVNVQSVCTEMQSSVKNAVQGMTGKAVGKVNIAVQGIDFCESAELKA